MQCHRDEWGLSEEHQFGDGLHGARFFKFLKKVRKNQNSRKISNNRILFIMKCLIFYPWKKYQNSRKIPNLETCFNFYPIYLFCRGCNIRYFTLKINTLVVYVVNYILILFYYINFKILILKN
jgi:hypothetical protein